MPVHDATRNGGDAARKDRGVTLLLSPVDMFSSGRRPGRATLTKHSTCIVARTDRVAKRQCPHGSAEGRLWFPRRPAAYGSGDDFAGSAGCGQADRGGTCSSPGYSANGSAGHLCSLNRIGPSGPVNTSARRGGQGQEGWGDPSPPGKSRKLGLVHIVPVIKKKQELSIGNSY